MKLQITYCSTPDGMGKDIRKIYPLSSLNTYSKLPFGCVKAYSIHKQDNNLIQCVLDLLEIEYQQLINIELID